MTDLAATQTKADAVAETFNHVLANADAMPPGAEKVAALHVARALLEDFRAAAGDGIVLTGVAAVEDRLKRIERDCRESGSLAAFAGLTRAERRRLQRIAGEIR